MARYTTFFALLPLITMVVLTACAATTHNAACLSDWPKNSESGQVELTYEIDDSCKPTNFEIVHSVPSGAFDSVAICMANHEHLGIDIPDIESQFADDASIEDRVLSVAEYRKLEDEYQKRINPDKYYSRSISVRMTDGSAATVTCHFDGAWSKTGAEITFYAGGKKQTQVLDDFSILPIQIFESRFRREQ